MKVKRIHVTGVVQGVGFRPFVYQIADRAHLKGWVANTSAGVDIELEGDDSALDAFVQALERDAPPLARIDTIEVQDAPADGHGFRGFEIRESVPVAGAFQPISPDISICPDCLRELFDPHDRRYRYPFINCTNCGPRFTIIQDIPYDRPLTTMRAFEMCDDCAREYHDPMNRRFHAQPIACPQCGPMVWVEPSSRLGIGDWRLESPTKLDAFATTRRLLAQGHVVAVKGLGGFHLACDATNERAVETLRQRKLRIDKPFALMMPDLATIEKHCFVSAAERALLESRERPIVLLRRRPDSNIAAVAPGQDTLGVMLPYTPLHYLLLSTDAKRTVEDAVDRPSALGGQPSAVSGRADALTVLVMTSGNLSEEPIAIDNAEARERLSGLADAFLMHDRAIHIRCDDSVVRVFSPPEAGRENRMREKVYPVRRSRGYAPFPVHLPFDAPTLLATGAELKNTFCITRDRYAFLSHHIGDMENYETLQSFESGVTNFERLFRIRPQALAYDLHPNYLATRYALERAEREGLRAIGVQHHHAHVAACMVENGLTGDRPVIGVAFDGTGYGDDGAIWGGEFLLADYAGYQRLFHIDYVPMPGGDKAVREPWRLALAWLARIGVPWTEEFPSVQAADDMQRRVLRQQIERGVNAPNTSSMGRLFDAVAALAGVRQKVNYEAQAAIEFEACVDPRETGRYLLDIRAGIVDLTPLIHAVVGDLRSGQAVGTIAARFHNGVASMVQRACMSARDTHGVNEVALSGGVWQNMTLLGKTVELLSAAGFTVYVHHLVPTNDGGLALGQAAVGCRRLEIGD